MAITHCIEEFQLDIAFGSEAQTRREQGRLAQWLSEDLLPALDALFTSHSPGHRLLRIERWEFDLGLVRGVNYQQQIKQQLLDKLAVLLRERRLELPGAAAALPGESVVGHGPRALEQLMLFLRTGQLPWHSEEPTPDTNVFGPQANLMSAGNSAGKHHQRLLAGLLTHPGLPDALRALPDREQLVQRLVSQFPDEQLSALVKQASPDFFRELITVWQLLSKLRNAGGLINGDLKKIWWKNILHLWLNREQSSWTPSSVTNSAAIDWPARLVRNLAADVNIPAVTLYQQLLQISQQYPVNATSEFVRYLRGKSFTDLIAKNPQTPPAGVRTDAAVIVQGKTESITATKNRGSALSQAQSIADDDANPFPKRTGKKALARELRYQLAHIFNGGQGEALALLWPELLAHHSELLRAALNHYLAIPGIRQKLVLQAPLALLGDIFAFLKPEWALASTYKAMVERLVVFNDAATKAAENGTTNSATSTSLVAAPGEIDIERDLWEISFNSYFRATQITHELFLRDVLAELAYRLGLEPEALKESARPFEEPAQGADSASVSGSPQDSSASEAPIAAILSPENHQASEPKFARKTVEQNKKYVAAWLEPLVAQLQQTILRELSVAEVTLLERLLALLLDAKTHQQSPQTDVRDLAAILQKAESLPDDILLLSLTILGQLAIQEELQLNAALTQDEWQLLSRYNFFKILSASASASASGQNIQHRHSTEGADANLERALLVEEASATAKFSKRPASEPSALGSDFVVASQDEPAAPIQQNHDLRWQEFLRQLEAGKIVLGDLHLNHSSGLQMVAHYLHQAGQIKAEFRQNLLDSIGAMSHRATDTADYFRRVIHCLVYQEPLDFDEILKSTTFWKTREKSRSPSSSTAVHRHDAINENAGKTSSVTPSLPPRSVRAPVMDEAVVSDAIAVSDVAAVNDVIVPNDGIVAETLPNYEQQLWLLLQNIKKSTDTVFELNLGQLQQLIEFYLAKSPELATNFRAELALAITKGASAVSDVELRFNYYANILRRLLASREIDVTDPQLFTAASWVKHGDQQREHSALESQVHPSADSDEISLAQAAAQDQPAHILAPEKVAQVWQQLQKGEAQLDEQQLTNTQWQMLVDIALVDNLDANRDKAKQTLLDQLSADVLTPEKFPNIYRRWLRQYLQSASLNRLIAAGAEYASRTMRESAAASDPNRPSISPQQDIHQRSAEELSVLMAASGDGELGSAQLSRIVEWLTSGYVQAHQLGMNLSQLKALVEFFIAEQPGLKSSQLDQVKLEIAAVKEDERQYYATLLQRLVMLHAESQDKAHAATGDANFAKHQYGARTISEDDEGAAIEQTIVAGEINESQQLAGISRSGLYEKHSSYDERAQEPDALSLAHLLAEAEHYPQQVPPQKNQRELLHLRDLLHTGQLHINQLHATWQQLAGFIQFVIDNQPGMSIAYRAQLNTAVEKYAKNLNHKRRYFAAVLQVLLNGTELDLEALAAQAESTPPKNFRESEIGQPQQNANTLATPLLEVESSGLQQIDPAAIQADDNPTRSATRDAQTGKQPVPDDHSLAELIHLPVLTQAQSVRLQQLLKAALNRGSAETIKLWFNPSIGESPLLRLISLLPDYALHQLVRLTYPSAYDLIYPQVKIVLDAVAVLAPHNAALHQEKWRFIFQLCLSSSASKPDHKKLLAFAQTLAKAVAISDMSSLEKLLQERLNLQAAEKKTSQEQQRKKTEELLQDALHEGIHLSNAGQVLAAPYMGRLFAMLNLTDQGEFVSLAAKDRAVHLLEYMVTGSSAAPEYDLILNKVLCGMSTSIPLSAGITLTEQEEAVTGQLLNSIIQNWKAIGATSIAGLRETFLRRQGWLRLDEDGWHLLVQPGPFDMLLDQLPWSISLIKHGWMDLPLRVSWRT
jgi:hypothetical protein